MPPQYFCPLTWTNSPHHRPPFLKCRSRSCDRSSRRPFTASASARHNSPFQSSQVQRFLPRLLSHHNLREPSQLARSVQRTTPRRSKMALALLQHPVPVSHQLMLLERLVLLHLPITYHLSLKKYCNASPNVSTLILLIFCLIIYTLTHLWPPRINTN